MKWTIVFLIILFGCNSQDPNLTSLQGLRDPSNPLPFITSVSVPAFALYETSDPLTFTATFSEPVLVEGTPQIIFTTEDGPYAANYTSGSGTNILTFEFVVAAGVSDANGITLSPGLLLGMGGSIYDPDDDDDALLTFLPPPTWGILIDAITPTIVSFSVPNGIYSPGQEIIFSANFSNRVCSSGNPKLDIRVGATARFADRIVESCSSTVKFRYVVQAGESDFDGVEILGSTINLSDIGSAINDSFSDPADLSYVAPAAYAGVLVSPVAGTGATISGFTSPTPGTYFAGSLMTFQVSFTKSITKTGIGTPQLPISINGVSYLAPFTAVSGNTAYFTFTTPTNIEITGVTITGTAISMLGTSQFIDSDTLTANVTYAAPATYAGVVISSTPPFESSARTLSSQAGWYKLDDIIVFELHFNEAVTVSGGTPHLSINIGGTSRTASWDSGSNNSTTLRFTYTVQATDYDTDGIVIGTISSNSATAKDIAGNSYNLNLVAWPANTFQIDGIVPSETVRSSPPDAAMLLFGANIDYSIEFSENIVVTGNPRVAITMGTQTVYADYLSSVNNVVNFRYVTTTGDEDLDNIVPAAALNFALGSIKDVAGNAKSATNLPWPNHSVKVDVRAPTINSLGASTIKGFYPGQSMTIVLLWSEAVTMNTTGGSPTITVESDTTSGAATLVNHTGTTSTFFYTVPAGSIALTGITYSAVNLNGATVKDALNQPADLTIGVPASPAAYFVPEGTVNWYDLSNTFATGAGATLASFKDLMGLRNGTVTGAASIPMVAGIAPGTRYAQFSGSAATYVTLGSTFSSSYALFVVDTSGAPSGTLYKTSTNIPYISLSAGSISGNSFCNLSACEFLGPVGFWVNSDFTGEIGVYGSGRKIIVVDFGLTPTGVMRVGQEFSGKIHEVILFSGVNARSAIDDFLPHLQTKYGASL